MSTIRTEHLRMVRGQTLRLTFTVRNQKGQAVDLTGATAYFRVRPDIKAAPVIQKQSPASGITISAQAGSTKGQFVATLAPADTASLQPGEWVYDSWIVEADGDRFPVVAPSSLTIIQEVTTIP